MTDHNDADSPVGDAKPVSAAPVTMKAKGGRSKVIAIVVAAVLGALVFSLLSGKKDKVTTAATVKPGVNGVTTTTILTPGKTPGAEPREIQVVTITGENLPNLGDGADTAVNKRAPKLSGFSTDGTPITIDPADGKAKVIFFVAHWCPHCQREVPLIAKWQKEGKLPTDLVYYTVSTSVQEKGPNYPPSAWFTKEAWPFPVMADDKANIAVKSYGFSGFPFFAVLRADGTIAARASGEMDLEPFLELLAKAKQG
jgi:cytochrome c biogenesis protein CcmG, thiol:disulfide interchange protein DsbE